MTHLMNTYGRQPVAFTHGKGVRLYDEAGREYLDAVAGVAVNTLGHGHPDLVQAVSRQASELIHCSNLYRVLAQEKLSDRLAELSGMAKLKPVFKKDGSVTAGNASGINDGAGAVVLMEAGAAARAGAKPLARLVSYAVAGVDPTIMCCWPSACWSACCSRCCFRIARWSSTR